MLEKVLKKYWGYDSFRPLQREIIQSVLDAHDTLGILPTGGGKSITFQVPGLILEGVVIVVTPLISLMKDQVDNLRKRNIMSVFFHHGMTMRERNIARERLFNNKSKFLYVSPERLASDAFINEIRTLKVSLIVIDEAHCISQWGYDFRPSYLKIKRLRKIFPKAPVLALTASATKEVAADICVQLEFRNGYTTFRQSIARDNLSYVVRPSEGKLFDIQKILMSVGGSAIVYVRSRKKTREIAEYLQNVGINASFYHAGLDSDLKAERQAKWKDDEIRVIVATNAFGMGIDKPDVRIVIHYDMPPSLEEYYQEAGRAGRDGKQAYAVLLTAPADKATLRRRLTMEFPPRDTVRLVYTRACVYSNLEIGEGYDKIVEFDMHKFCTTFNMDERVVRPSLRILGQAGYLDFIEESQNSSRLMVTVDREELYRVRFTSREQETLLTAILRNYPGLFVDYVFINENKLAYLTQLPPETIYKNLVDLSKAKIIHFIPRRKTPLLHFPTSMEESRYVVIGRNIYEERIDILRNRIEAMIDYGYSEGGCKVRKLMRYFGEEEQEDCGHCDTCRKKKNSVSRGANPQELAKRLMEEFHNHGGQVSEADLKNLSGKDYDAAVDMLRHLAQDGELTFSEGIWKLRM